MNFEKVTYEAEKKLLDEISSEKKFLTFKKLFKILACLHARIHALGNSAYTGEDLFPEHLYPTKQPN